MSINPASPEWQNALRTAPDEYQVVTTYRRYNTESNGKTVARERCVGRMIVVKGRVHYEEFDKDHFPSPRAI